MQIYECSKWRFDVNPTTANLRAHHLTMFSQLWDYSSTSLTVAARRHPWMRSLILLAIDSRWFPKRAVCESEGKARSAALRCDSCEKLFPLDLHAKARCFWRHPNHSSARSRYRSHLLDTLHCTRASRKCNWQMRENICASFFTSHAWRLMIQLNDWARFICTPIAERRSVGAQ